MVVLCVHLFFACLRQVYIYIVVLRAHPIHGESHLMQCQRRGCNNIPSFLQRTTPFARSFCEGLTWHDLHTLVTAPFCCGSESSSGMYAKLRTVAASNNRVHLMRSLSSSQLASTINCSPGSQALLQVTHQNHSIGITLLLLVCAMYIYCCSSPTSCSWWIIHSTQRHQRGYNSTTYIWVLFFSHIPFMVNHIFSTMPTERLQQWIGIIRVTCNTRLQVLWKVFKHVCNETCSIPCYTVL